MIEGFESPHPAEPLQKNRLQAIPALASGLIAGIVLLIVPHASPWEGLTSFTPAIVGRMGSAAPNLPVIAAIVLHLAVSLIYGFLVSLTVINFRELWAVLVGGLMGLLLYLVNFGVVSAFWPALRGNEVSVIITHAVFGMIAAGAYRGLLRRKVSAALDER
jgi:hypothetical protein